MDSSTGGNKPLTVTEAVSLRDYFERRFVDLERQVDIKFDALERALDKADAELKAKFITVNEFRGTLSDQAGEFVTKDKVDVMLEAVKARTHALEQARAVQEGKASMSAVYLAYGVAVVGIILSVVGLLQ